VARHELTFKAVNLAILSYFMVVFDLIKLLQQMQNDIERRVSLDG
jgi:hypothetical protein